MFTDHPGTLPARKKVVVSMTEETMDRIVASKSKNALELMGLWLFYAKTARIQGNNQPKASVYFAAKGCNTSEFKIRQLRKELAALGLIECIQKNGKGGLIEHYVRVNFLASESNHPPQNTVSGESEPKCSRKVSLNTRGIKKETGMGYQPSPQVPSPEPKQLSRLEQAKALKTPQDVPQTQEEFDHFIAMKGLEMIEAHHDDLFDKLQLTRWHKWNKSSQCYKPIRDWQAYLVCFEERLLKDKKIYGRRPQRLDRHRASLNA